MQPMMHDAFRSFQIQTWCKIKSCYKNEGEYEIMLGLTTVETIIKEPSLKLYLLLHVIVKKLYRAAYLQTTWVEKDFEKYVNAFRGQR